MAPKNFDEQLKYYQDNYDEVRVVTCTECKSPLAFEVKGGRDNAGNPHHPEGFEVIPVSYPDHPLKMALMSWRPRLDGLTGYECGAMIDNPDYAKAEAKAKELDEANKAEYAAIKKAHAAAELEYAKQKQNIPKRKKGEAYDYDPNKAEDPTPPGDLPAAPEPVQIFEPKQKPCKTSTILSDQERGKVPESTGAGGQAPSFGPFERNSLAAEIRLSGKKPDVEEHGNIKRIEKFKIERIK